MDKTTLLKRPAKKLNFQRGQILTEVNQSGPLWLVETGAFLLERPNDSEDTDVLIAVQGDFIGAESIWGQPYSFKAVSLMTSSVKPIPCETDLHRAHFASLILIQHQRRTFDMLRLKTGSVEDRLKTLLQMLTQQKKENALHLIESAELPSLFDIARVVNSAMETVCRGLNQIKPHRSRKPKTHSLPKLATHH
jgi:hypothetical protein